MIKCPYCDQELEWVDTFGKIVSSLREFESGNAIFEKSGSIYKCNNKGCRSRQFDYCFYSKVGQDKIFAGYPY